MLIQEVTWPAASVTVAPCTSQISRAYALEEFRWALQSGGRARGDTIDLAAALTVPVGWRRVGAFGVRLIIRATLTLYS